MSRLLAIFSVTAVLSAALVAAAATGVFSPESATNSSRTQALTNRSGPLGGSDLSVDEVRQRALDAQKALRENAENPSQEGFLPQEPIPALIANSPEEDAASAIEGRVSPDAAVTQEGEVLEENQHKITPEGVKEIIRQRKANDPYKVVGPKVIHDHNSGTTIIDTSPYKN